MCCPSARRAPLARSYNDIDFVAPKRHGRSVETLLARLGYEPDAEFNAIHGRQRMFFVDRAHAREADVFIDSIRGCHRLDLDGRLTATHSTLAPADLLLSKLQVRETNRKDHLDIFALLVDHQLTDDDRGINRTRLIDVCCNDWGWWRTVTEVAERVRSVAEEVLDSRELKRVSSSLHELHMMFLEAPKSTRWKLRARVGDRVPWYEMPEEVEH
jgi:hypothetical protein